MLQCSYLQFEFGAHFLVLQTHSFRKPLWLPVHYFKFSRQSISARMAAKNIPK